MESGTGIDGHAAKTGSQAAYTGCRCIDARPNMEAIKTFAELSQAESEELALAVTANHNGIKGTTPVVKTMAASPPTSSTTTSATSTPEQRGSGGEARGDCRFWLSEKGCRWGV